MNTQLKTVRLAIVFWGCPSPKMGRVGLCRGSVLEIACGDPRDPSAKLADGPYYPSAGKSDVFYNVFLQNILQAYIDRVGV